jgi:SH3-like domain-containing protein
VRFVLGVVVAGGLILAAASGVAQTLTPPPAAHGTAPAHASSGKQAAPKKPAAKKPLVKKAALKKGGHPAGEKQTPVVKPKHGASPRRPVHPKQAVVEAPKEPAKPVAKPAPKPVKPPVPANIGTNTGLPLPRYASLKTDEINMRTGPGVRFPVLWTYKRRELPVRIEREFDVWRLVEDMDGIKGWVNGATLTGRRTFVVTGSDARTLRAEASDDSAAVALLKPGVVGRVKSCDAASAWCQVQAGGYRGFLQRSLFWGTDAGEAVAP